MRPISPKIKKDLIQIGNTIGCYRKYVLNDHVCRGRITMEHALIYAHKQIDEFWAIVPLCAYSHSVDEYMDSGIVNKEINEWIAIGRATLSDLAKYPKRDWSQRMRYLESKFGKFPENKKHPL